MNEPRNLTIDGDRLWNSIMEIAKIGATEEGGSRRLALTDLDREVGECLKLVKQTGGQDNTIVIFSSEQGAQLPFVPR